MPPRLLTLTTDFGLDDYYVAAVKGTVLRLAPHASIAGIVDVTHRVPAGDLAAGAFILAAAVPWFPAGTVHLAVVDPGVGSRRRILVARTATAWLVAPDNGLLTYLLDGTLPPGAEAIREIRSVESAGGIRLFLSGSGQTFHGRDRFAPVAAYLLGGGPAEALGPEVSDPQRLPVAPPRRGQVRLEGEVIHIDTYGNLVTNVPSDWLLSCRTAQMEVEGHAAEHLVTHYQEIPAGKAAFLPGSLGTLEVSLRGEDLARRWGVRRGARVLVTLVEGAAVTSQLHSR